jgi:hypothetical protein
MSEPLRRRVDRISAEGYLEGLSAWPLAELRTRRGETSEEEALLSYERRLLHGKIAIARGELAQREGGEPGALVDRLKDLLSDGTVGGSRGGGNLIDPKILFDRPSRPTTKLAMDDALTRLDEMSDEDLRTRIAEYEDAERIVSAMRATILQVLDALNEELGRRYASGEADPADALRS